MLQQEIIDRYLYNICLIDIFPEIEVMLYLHSQFFTCIVATMHLLIDIFPEIEVTLLRDN